jgi:uncharacterized membrane protein
MSKILEKLYSALILSAALVLLIILAFHSQILIQGAGYWAPFFTWLHVLSGVLWIGLLYYFNIVQMPTMPKIPAELKPAIGKFIAPEALFWFRWAALSTVVTGLLVATLNGYGHEALTLQPSVRTIGTGMWLGLIMAFNVWVIIWPNQKRALGIVPADDALKAKSARLAMLASRTNFVLSLPMLYCMVTARLLN